jgi:hemerythrin
MISSDLPTKLVPITGSTAMDAEHGVQLGLLEASLTALSTCADSAPELVDQLITYTQAHFLSEQLLMRLAAPPNYEGHVQEHEYLLQQLDTVRSKLISRDYADAASHLKEHEIHLLQHIRTWDRSVE